MFERWLQWFGRRPRPGETLAPTGRLEIAVDGERWRPVATLVDQGPDERVYLLRVDGDTTTIAFGDGTTGRRPRDGARIGSTYRHGIGGAGDRPPDHIEQDPLRTLLELLAKMADDMAAAQEQIANEAFIETASGAVFPLTDADALRRALEDDGNGIEVRIRFRPRTHRDPP